MMIVSPREGLPEDNQNTEGDAAEGSGSGGDNA